MSGVVPSRSSFDAGWTVQPPAGPFAALTGEVPEPTAVTLPHDALRDQVRSADATAGAASGYYPGGAWSYAKTFEAPAEWQNAWVALEFDGAYRDALVYLNSALVAQRPNGYARFFAEISPYLCHGATNELRVEVRVHKDSRWYTGAGLYRGVRLWLAGPVHVAGDGVSVTTPEVDAELAVVEVVTTLRNDTARVRTVEVATTILGPDGQELAAFAAPATVLPSQPALVRHRLYLPSPHQWTPDDPALHTVRTVVSDGDLLDNRTTPFGIRTIRLDPQRGLRINDEPVKLRGACVHHDNGPLGAVSLPIAEERRVARLKEAGFNALRMAHNPASQALLDACDRLGMLVMNEAFDAWTLEKSEFDDARTFAEWWPRDIESMVLGSRNHPSVIMYSIGNEILELGNPVGAHLGRQIAERVRTLDPSRPITNGINVLLAVDLRQAMAQAGGLNALMGGGAVAEDDASGDAGQSMAEGMSRLAASDFVTDAIAETASTLDVVGYNYAESRFEVDARLTPHRIVLGSETFPTQIAANWDLVQRHPHVLGDFTWTGWDYLGEAGVGGAAYAEVEEHVPGFLREFPYLTAYVGDIDITGHRRPASYYRELVFGLRSEPYIAVQRPEHHGHTRLAPNAWGWSDSVSSWTWPEHEDHPVVVEVYVDADEVELLLDGQSLGRAAVGEQRAFLATFETTYRPGELVALAFRQGQCVGQTTLRSAVGPTRLVARPERTDVPLTDLLAYVPITLEDDEGTLMTGGDRPVTVCVDGPAELAGFASADPRTEERFDAATRTTWDGRALAILKFTGPGQVTITARARGLPDSVARVAVAT